MRISLNDGGLNFLDRMVVCESVFHLCFIRGPSWLHVYGLDLTAATRNVGLIDSKRSWSSWSLPRARLIIQTLASPAFLTSTLRTSARLSMLPTFAISRPPGRS